MFNENNDTRYAPVPRESYSAPEPDYRRNTPQYPLYAPYTHTPPGGQPRAQKAPARGRGAGFVAAMLVMALLGGTAGGGLTAWRMMSNRAEELPAPAEKAPQTPQTVSSAALPPAAVTRAVISGDVTAVVEKAARSVVEISLGTRVQTFFGEQESVASGSGVILTQDGYIVTNNHVVESSENIRVRTFDGTEYEGELIGTDAKTDLAVIKVEADGLTPAAFADSDSVKVGQVAVAIGNPLGTLGGTVTSGIISAMNRELTIGDETMNLLQTSAAVNPGNSGGGLFNEQGEMVGVINAKSGGMNIEGLGFAIPANIAKTVTDDLIANGYVTGRPELGIKVVPVNDARTAAYYGFDGPGVYVMEVTRPGNGLEAGDRLVSIGGKAVEAVDDVSEAVRAAGVGDVLRIEVVRDGRRLTQEVPVAEQLPEELRAKITQPTGEI